jgi:hypothetical protein
MEIISGIFESCLTTGTAWNGETGKQTDDSQSSKRAAAARQGHAKVSRERNRNPEKDIGKLEEIARPFHEKIKLKDPKEDLDFLLLGKHINGSDHNDLKPDKLDVPDAAQISKEVNDDISKKWDCTLSKFTRRISFVRLCHGHRDYELLRALFGSPAVSTLWRKHQTKVDRMNRQLTIETGGALQTIQYFRRQNRLEDSTVHANLSVGAFCIIPDMTETDFPPGCFLFML